MKQMNLHDVIKRLVGDINPVGSTHVDDKRLENLKVMCELVTKLVQDIDRVAYDNKDRQEHSIKEAVEYASKYLTNSLGIKD